MLDKVKIRRAVGREEAREVERINSVCREVRTACGVRVRVGQCMAVTTGLERA